MKPRQRMNIAITVTTGNTVIHHDIDLGEQAPQQTDSSIFRYGMQTLGDRVGGMLRALEPTKEEPRA